MHGIKQILILRQYSAGIWKKKDLYSLMFRNIAHSNLQKRIMTQFSSTVLITCVPHELFTYFSFLSCIIKMLYRKSNLLGKLCKYLGSSASDLNQKLSYAWFYVDSCWLDNSYKAKYTPCLFIFYIMAHAWPDFPNSTWHLNYGIRIYYALKFYICLIKYLGSQAPWPSGQRRSVKV